MIMISRRSIRKEYNMFKHFFLNVELAENSSNVDHNFMVITRVVAVMCYFFFSYGNLRGAASHLEKDVV